MKKKLLVAALAAPLALAACGGEPAPNAADANLTVVDDLNTSDPLLVDEDAFLNDAALDGNLVDPLNETLPADNATNAL